MFLPEGSDRTFAEMESAEKMPSVIAQGLQKLIDYLKRHYDKENMFGSCITDCDGCCAGEVPASGQLEHLSRISGNNNNSLVDTDNKVFYLADGWLYSYDKDNDESVFYTK